MPIYEICTDTDSMQELLAPLHWCDQAGIEFKGYLAKDKTRLELEQSMKG